MEACLATQQLAIEARRTFCRSLVQGALRVVFRPADKPAPKVSNLQLKDENGQLSTSATVDGENLSISAPE